MYKYVGSLSLAAILVACQPQTPPPTPPAPTAGTALPSSDTLSKPDTGTYVDTAAINAPPIRRAKPTLAPPQLTFEKTTFNYGKAKPTDTIRHKFIFTNTGGRPLEIANVTTSWGSALANYPKLPIVAGEKGAIEVEATLQGKSGKLNTTITIFSNAADVPQTLTLTGEVVGK